MAGGIASSRTILIPVLLLLSVCVGSAVSAPNRALTKADAVCTIGFNKAKAYHHASLFFDDATIAFSYAQIVQGTANGLRRVRARGAATAFGRVAKAFRTLSAAHDRGSYDEIHAARAALTAEVRRARQVVARARAPVCVAFLRWLSSS